jgi:hypothetical protein
MSQPLTEPELDNCPRCGNHIAELCTGVYEAENDEGIPFEDPWVTYKCLEFIECGEIFTVFASTPEGLLPRDGIVWHDREYQDGNEFLPSSLDEYQSQIELYS